MSGKDQPEAEPEHDGISTSGLKPQLEQTPTVLILDTSASMTNPVDPDSDDQTSKIDQLNEGLEFFYNEVRNQEHAKDRVNLAVVTFGQEAEVYDKFTSIENWSPPTLDTGGNTPMGEAIKMGLDLVEERKQFYKDEGIHYYRPLVWLLTDGQPTDMSEDDQLWDEVQQELKEGSESGGFEFFAFGVRGAEMETLTKLVEDPTGRPGFKIREGMFDEFFDFLSNSMESASNPNSSDAFTLGKEKELDALFQVGPDK